MNVYYYDFSGSSRTFDELLPFLSEQRKSYCSKMKSSSSQLHSAYAYILLRFSLLKEYGINAMPDFSFSEHGKPILDGIELDFSVSHDDKKVICVVSDKSVGADIQSIRRISRGAAEKFCTADELTSIDAITDEQEKYAEICRLWCIKESRGKLTGKGFQEGFHNFSADSLIRLGEAAWIKKDNCFISVCGADSIMLKEQSEQNIFLTL